MKNKIALIAVFLITLIASIALSVYQGGGTFYIFLVFINAFILGYLSVNIMHGK